MITLGKDIDNSIIHDVRKPFNIYYAPAFEKVKQELQSEQIEFVEINVENDPDNLSGQYGVRGIPHTVVVQEGAETKSRSGGMSVEELKQFILN